MLALYGSASTFSTAFSRHVGQPPSRYARQQESMLIQNAGTSAASARHSSKRGRSWRLNR
jgi:AraC-like DNA-binding protein